MVKGNATDKSQALPSKPAGQKKPPAHKSLLQYSGAEPSQPEDLKRKAAALYAANKQNDQASRPHAHAPITIRPMRDPRPAPVPSSSGPAPTPKCLPSIEELMAAPRYGLNARELILQATAQLATSPVPASFQPQARAGSQPRPRPAAPPPAARFNPLKLLEAMPPATRPQVEYSPRSSIPRLQRQGCSDSLLGQYLGLALTLCGVASPGDEDNAVHKAIQSSEGVRKVACTCAAAHETWLYKQVVGKQAYTQICNTSKAQATRALLKEYGGAALQALMQRHGVSEADLEEGHRAQQAGQEGKTGSMQAEQAMGQDEDLFGEESESESEEGGESAKQVLSAAQQTQEHAVRETAGREQRAGPPAFAGLQSGQEPVASGSADVKVSLAAARTSDRTQAEPGPGVFHVDPGLGGESGLQAPAMGAVKVEQDEMHDNHEGLAKRPRIDAEGPQAPNVAFPSHVLLPSQPQLAATASHSPTHVLSPARHSPQAPVDVTMQQPPEQPAQVEGDASGGQPGVEGHASGGYDGGVAAQVGEFVRGVLEPYIRAQLLDKQQYKHVIRKAVHKVMSHHKSATSATFLLKEHDAVRRLVTKLVEAATA